MGTEPVVATTPVSLPGHQLPQATLLQVNEGISGRDWHLSGGLYCTRFSGVGASLTQWGLNRAQGARRRTHLFFLLRW